MTDRHVRTWQRPEDDLANADGHRDLIAALDRFAVGRYVGVSDIATDPKRAETSFRTGTLVTSSSPPLVL
jgi:hypothetical protein